MGHMGHDSQGKRGCWPRWLAGHHLLTFLDYPPGREKEISPDTEMDMGILKVSLVKELSDLREDTPPHKASDH